MSNVHNGHPQEVVGPRVVVEGAEPRQADLPGEAELVSWWTVCGGAEVGAEGVLVVRIPVGALSVDGCLIPARWREETPAGAWSHVKCFFFLHRVLCFYVLPRDLE